MRQCSKPGCRGQAVATLTYDYANSTVVLGPIATSPEPHSFDFCEVHAEGLTVPRGWEVIRLQSKFEPAPPSADDLLALVEVVREVAGNGAGTEELDSERLSSGPYRTLGSPEDKYAPLRQREHFTVIEGEAEPPAVPDPACSRRGPLADAGPDPLS